MVKLKITVLFALILIVQNVFADEASRAEAENLLDTMDMEATLSDSIDRMLEVQIQANPSIEPYKDTMREFFTKYMSYESLKDEIVGVYADAFSAQELKEINAFYSTPTGQKTVQLLPDLMGKGAEIGAARVQQNVGELQRMIQERSQAEQQPLPEPAQQPQ